jgi:hypothetical protein
MLFVSIPWRWSTGGVPLRAGLILAQLNQSVFDLQRRENAHYSGEVLLEDEFVRYAGCCFVPFSG